MQKFYLIPIDQVGNYRGPKYFQWRYGTGIQCSWSMMDYGFFNEALLVAKDITQVDHDALILNSDVYAYPDNLDQAIPGNDPIGAFFETVEIPTDWLTASTTYLEQIRSVAGLFQFNQRYGGISGESLLGGSITLDSHWNDLTAQQQSWFNQTVLSFGYNYTVTGNPRLRQLAKQVGDLWGASPFFIGGVEF